MSVVGQSPNGQSLISLMFMFNEVVLGLLLRCMVFGLGFGLAGQLLGLVLALQFMPLISQVGKVIKLLTSARPRPNEIGIEPIRAKVNPNAALATVTKQGCDLQKKLA